ncbi:MAG: DUF4823 domain-containing protein [Alphaproteobacteria bacterium]|nr:DUF4823 domain-containing protein [Alphaproteobacteria bacterium]
MKKVALFIMGTLLLAGCTFVGTSENIGRFEGNDKTIDVNASFFLIHPKPGYKKSFVLENRVENKGSAKAASDVFFKKFHKKFGSLTRSDENMTIEEGLRTAKARGDKYLITMDIDEWNSEFYMHCRAVTQRSGSTTAKTDSIDVSVQVYDVRTGNLLNKQRLQNSGCPVVFLNIIPVGTMGPKGRFDASLDKWFKNIQ